MAQQLTRKQRMLLLLGSPVLTTSPQSKLRFQKILGPRLDPRFKWILAKVLAA